MVTYVAGMTDDDQVFRALADPTRRFLLDRLFARDGRTLTELESEVEMTRFGVMKHLKVLEDAGLVVTRRSGREKRHFLNPVPIRLVHDRWIHKYAERQVSALVALKARLEGGDEMASMTETGVATQVYRVYIKAPAQAVWDALTQPEWTTRYGYGARSRYDLRPGGVFQAFTSDVMKRDGVARGFTVPEVAVDGEVVEADPPRRLVTTWRMRMDPALEAEGFTRLTYEIEEGQGGVTRLTVVHELGGAAKLAALVAGGREAEGAGGGWPWVLSELKTLLETGGSFRD